MKVLIISTSVFPVPPRAYGGLEKVVYDLAVALDELGHEVSVACPSGSRLPRGIEHLNTGEASLRNPEAEAYERYKDSLGEFDVILDHTWSFPAWRSLAEEPKLRILKTLHGLRPWRHIPPVDVKVLGVSKFHRDFIRAYYGMEADYAYNGLNLSEYELQLEKEDYLLYLARVERQKGALLFIKLCEKLRRRGILAGEDEFTDDPGFPEEAMRICCESKWVEYRGRIDQAEKLELLSKASALVAPLLPPYQEVFGLYIVEANTCGTPVVATRNGATPELVKDGLNGFLCEGLSVEELAEKVRRAEKLDPSSCRRAAERFSRERMAERYAELMESTIED